MKIEPRNLQATPVSMEALRRVIHATATHVRAPVDVVGLVLVDDERIAELNQRFRGLDGPTDVISFEAEEEGPDLVGEIIVSVQTARRQAEAAGHDLDTELAWLVAHGMLHVAGMDDSTPEQLEDMLHLQRIILTQLGLHPR
jgi:probable rRNA maturation factor